MGSRVWCVLGLALSAALAVLVGASIVSAHDHHLPGVRLHAGGESARLHPWSLEWVRRNGGHCIAEAADGVPRFRPIVEVARLRVAPKVILHKEQRPRAVTAFVDDELKDGYLAHGRRVHVDLRPRTNEGRRLWVGQMHVTVRQRLFFDVSARWRDEEGCGGREDASWSFRLRRA